MKKRPAYSFTTSYSGVLPEQIGSLNMASSTAEEYKHHQSTTDHERKGSAEVDKSIHPGVAAGI